MEELATLVKQVQMLKESVDMMLTRGEQLYKLQEERLNVLPQLAEALTQVREELEATDQALKDALGDLDSSVDGIKKATAALLLIQQQQNQQPVSAT